MSTVTYTVIDGEIISENRDGVVRDYVNDASGNVVALLDENQNITDTFTYWPFGEERSRTGTTPTPFRFGGAQGFYRDSASKIYARTRYLDTEKGRWFGPSHLFGSLDLCIQSRTSRRRNGPCYSG